MQHRKLGRYELLRVLGKGAMGVVYEGRDPNLDRHVAIKTIMVDDLGPAAAAEYEARFRTEARSAARLHHANIVTVHDSDRDGDTAFLVMEYIQGDDLKHHLDTGATFSPQEALHIVCDLLAALDFAHQQGVIHRDVKPANLLIEPGGRLKLTDFGVARITGDATRTQGTMVGTLKYMAPEQVQGLRVDTRADLFSAGVVAYQLFTGTRPFDGDNDFSIIHQIIGHTPPAPSSVRPELPQAIDAVMARGMAKDRDQRFQTAGEFSNALQAAFGATFDPVAPSLPARAVAGAAAVSVSSVAPTMPGSGIGQELELEYWRAVRDATDPQELQGFLQRFPQGIYADLARRRLQRLGEAAPDPDRTVLQGMTRPPARPPAESNLDPTLQMLARPSAPPIASTPAATDPSAGSASTPIAGSTQHAAAEKPRAFRKPLLVAAIAGVAVLGIAAAVLMSGRSKEASVPALAAAPAVPPAAAASVAGASVVPADSAALPAGSVAQAAASAPAAASAASAAHAASQRVAAASPAAQRRREPASAARAPSAVPQAEAPRAPEARAEPPAQAVAAAPAPPPPAAPAAAVAQRLPTPQEACKDKIFVAKDLCLHFECQKPQLERLPFCVRLKAEARAREEAAEKAQMTR